MTCLVSYFKVCLGYFKCHLTDESWPAVARKHKHRGTLRELRTEVLDVNIERKWKDIYLQPLTLSSVKKV